ncbi:MAG: hypothetical protein EOP84_15300, partial [Verrucomicrobiaceae bacterium]
MSNSLMASAPEVQTENNGNAAKFSINSPQAQKVTLYFLAQCSDDKHDSWFLDMNGQKATVNDAVTGTVNGDVLAY